MTQDEMFAKLKEPVDRLHGLLADPHPGLFTWCEFVGRDWKAIAELWAPTQRVEYRCLWEERMAWLDSPDGFMWMPCSGKVHPEIGPCITERANRLRDPKFRNVHIEARPTPNSTTWLRPWEVRPADEPEAAIGVMEKFPDV